MTTTDQTSSTTVRALFDAVDRSDVDAVVELAAADIHFRFGNADPTDGKAAFTSSAQAFSSSIASIRHEIHNLWEVDQGTVVCVMDVHYRRLDGRRFTLPCCNVFIIRNGLVHDYRIYMDISPVTAA
jgi:ketosteroid isomerase-like protein